MALAIPSLASHLAIPASPGQTQGTIPRGQSPLDGGVCNYNIYETKDKKFLSVGALEEHFWKRFCDSHFKNQSTTPADSSQPSSPLSNANSSPTTLALVQELFRSKTQAEWLDLTKDMDVCIEPVLWPSEVPSHPQHQARRSFLHSPDPTAKVPPQIVLGPRLSNHPPEYLSRARKLGEDTDSVLSEGGFSREEINSFRSNGTIA
jgi:alpha-methylacyl-CoA racemase